MTRAPVVLALLSAACHGNGPQASPLGTLGGDALKSWQSECSTPLVETAVCGRLEPSKCDSFFHTIEPQHGALTEDVRGSSATSKRACSSEGWALWTDARERIVAFCIAPTNISEWVRMHQFIERHSGKAIADKVDEFSKAHPVTGSTDGWSSWGAPGMVPHTPQMVGADGCIEFRLNP